jgi:hypothetical protein
LFPAIALLAQTFRRAHSESQQVARRADEITNARQSESPLCFCAHGRHALEQEIYHRRGWHSHGPAVDRSEPHAPVAIFRQLAQTKDSPMPAAENKNSRAHRHQVG